jgi:hypothetical protein
MARMPRLVVPGYPHHVTLVSESAREAETEIWAHCLMPNHVHLGDCRFNRGNGYGWYRISFRDSGFCGPDS